MFNPQRFTTENAESKSKEDRPLLSASYQYVIDKIVDVNTTTKQSVDLTQHVQEADVQDGNSSKVYESSVDKNKNLKNPCTQYQSRFKARINHDKEWAQLDKELAQLKYSSAALVWANLKSVFS